MDDLEALQAQQAVYSNFRILPKIIKPCVAYFIVHNPKNKMFNPDDYAFIIATELRRAQQNRQKADMILKAWNNKNNPALRPNELNGIIERAYRKPYSYGCNNIILKEYCPGTENCTYYKGLFARKGRHNEGYFYKYGWQHVLKNYQVCLYHGLKVLEDKFRLKSGELIIAAYRDIHKGSGVHPCQITQGLNTMQNQGLIRWKKGLPFKWRETASEVRRIIPIPRPKNHAKMHKS